MLRLKGRCKLVVNWVRYDVYMSDMLAYISHKLKLLIVFSIIHLFFVSIGKHLNLTLKFFFQIFDIFQDATGGIWKLDLSFTHTVSITKCLLKYSRSKVVNLYLFYSRVNPSVIWHNYYQGMPCLYQILP